MFDHQEEHAGREGEVLFLHIQIFQSLHVLGCQE